jgi:hypothetical protein
MSVPPINPNDDNLAPELPQQEPIKAEKKEKIVDKKEESEQQVFDKFLKKESTDDNKSEIPQDIAQFQDIASKIFSEAIKQGGSVGTINFQFGGVSATNLHSSGDVIGGNQVNTEGVPFSSSSSTDNTSGIDYAAIESIEARIKQWFEDHQAIHYRSLMISMAFLNGSDLTSINSLRDKLELALRSKSKVDDKEIDKESDKFKNLELGKRFKIILAHVEKGIENTEFGDNQFEVILFDTQDFQAALLKYIWDEQDYYWRITLNCLMEVSTEHSSQTKVRLAAALSESCKYRFDLVRELILLPLAKSDNPVQRGIAALCLGITALGDSPQKARNLLSHWSTLKNSPNIRKTSTEAYSLYVGLKFVDEVFERFLTTAKSNDVVFLLDILEGIVTLFERSESVPENRLAILRHLETWQNYPEKASPYKIAALVTWRIMKTSDISIQSIQELNIEKLPTLFWLSKKGATSI